MVFEVRSTGATTNGGGFKTGASGTDWSQQDAAQYSVTDGVTAGTTTITSATANFGTDVVGNVIYVQGGTGAVTAGWYEITVRNSSTSITVDRSTGLTAGTGVTLKIGGALSTIALALALMTVGGMQTYVKATATYSISTGLATPAGISANTNKSRIIGYTTTRADLGRPTIQTSAAIVAYTDNNGGFSFENFIVDGNTTGNIGVYLQTANSSVAFNCLLKRFLDCGAKMSSGGALIQCEVTTCGGASALSAVNVTGTGTITKNCFIHDNTTAGIEVVGGQGSIIGCVITNNTGASSDGVRMNAVYSSGKMSILNNVFYANGRDGYRTTGIYAIGEISNNIFVNNVGIGLNVSALSPVVNDVLIHHNAYYNNGTIRSGANAGTGDVTLTGDPFTNAAGNDFSLNNTASAGAACRSVGYPGILIGGGTGYEDIGALRHQDPAAATTVANPLAGYIS